MVNQAVEITPEPNTTAQPLSPDFPGPLGQLHQFLVALTGPTLKFAMPALPVLSGASDSRRYICMAAGRRYGGVCEGRWEPVRSLADCRYNMMARWLIPAGAKRKLREAELAAYMGPFAWPTSRLPTWIFAQQILASRDYLAEVEAGLAKRKDLR